MKSRFVLIGFVFLAVLAGLVSGATQSRAAGSAGFGLLLEDYETFLATEPYATALRNVTLGFWVKNNFYVDAEIWATSSDLSESVLCDGNWYGNMGFESGSPAFRLTSDAADVTQFGTSPFHVAYTIAMLSETTQVGIYLNGNQVAFEEAPFLIKCFEENFRLYLGRAFGPVGWNNRPQSVVDQVFIVADILNQTQIQQLSQSPPSDPAILANLITYLDFENVSTAAPYEIISAFDAPLNARMYKSAFHITSSPTSFSAPVRVASDFPFWGSGHLVAKQAAPDYVNMTLLPSFDAFHTGDPIVVSLPNYGDLFIIDGNGVVSSSPITATPATIAAPGALQYRATFIQGRTDSFEFTVDGDPATVVIVPNSPPVPRPVVSVFTDQDDSAECYLSRFIYYPEGAEKPFDTYMVDADADPITCTLLTLPPPEAGAILIGDVEITSVPTSVPDCLAVYRAPEFASGPDLAVLSVALSDGLAEATYNLSLNVHNRFYPRKPAPIALTSAENQPQLVQLANQSTIIAGNISSFHEAAPNAIDRYFATIVSWPSKGKLYQPDGTTLIEPSPPVIAAEFQWAAEVPQFSSEWYDPNGYGAKELVGAPDAFPKYGDNQRAWSPLFSNHEEWLVVRFNSSVYPTGIDVYQVWSTNTIWRVSALDKESDQWVILWQSDRSAETLAKPLVFSPRFCPVSFVTDTIRIEIAPAGESTYVEIDAISLTGTKTAPQLDLVHGSAYGISVVYKPDLYSNGVDKFEYTTNRCLNYAQRKDIKATFGEATLTVMPINQRPMIIDAAIVADLSKTKSASNVTFWLPISDIELTSPLLTVTILSLPSTGSLIHVPTNMLLSIGDTFSGNDSLVFMPLQCSAYNYEVYNATIGVKVADEALSAQGNVTVTVDCNGHVVRISNAMDSLVIAIASICSIIIVVFIVLVIVWRERPTIHSVSPLFCVITLIGALMANLSPIFLTKLATSCIAWMCLLTFGIVFFFGSMAAKTYRIDKIFNEKSFSVFSIPNWLLLTYVGVLCIVNAILMIIWRQVDIFYLPIPSSDRTVAMCYSDLSNVNIGVQFAFLIGLYIFTAVFAWRVRRIPLTTYKESREIFFSTYNVGFVALVAVTLTMVFWYEPNASVVVCAVGTCFASTVSSCIIFLPKFWKIARNEESFSNSGSSGSRAGASIGLTNQQGGGAQGSNSGGQSGGAGAAPALGQSGRGSSTMMMRTPKGRSSASNQVEFSPHLQQQNPPLPPNSHRQKGGGESDEDSSDVSDSNSDDDMDSKSEHDNPSTSEEKPKPKSMAKAKAKDSNKQKKKKKQQKHKKEKDASSSQKSHDEVFPDSAAKGDEHSASSS